MLSGNVIAIYIGLKLMESHIQCDFKGYLCITEVITQHYFRIQWRRVLSTVRVAKPVYERHKILLYWCLVQLTGLVGPKISDVCVIVVSDVSEKFWRNGSPESLVIPKIIFWCH